LNWAAFAGHQDLSPELWVKRSSVDARAAQVVENLNGGHPAEMPIFQETHWELIINLKAAKELGLELPPRARHPDIHGALLLAQKLI
jgi:hypothetical protein